jgi:hypothetical protein
LHFFCLNPQCLQDVYYEVDPANVTI